MKKLIGIICLAACIAALCSCGFGDVNEEPKTPDIVSETAPETETEAVTGEIDYYYNVLEMQNVKSASFTRKEDHLDPEKAKDSICIIAQCPGCGKETEPLWLDPQELDFSSGDSIQYGSVYNCYQCSFNGGSGNYTWIIGIEREPDWKTY